MIKRQYPLDTQEQFPAAFIALPVPIFWSETAIRKNAYQTRQLEQNLVFIPSNPVRCLDQN